MGVIPPGVEDGVGFNAFLADRCHEHGALFISDEVMTGFRVSRSGQYGLDGVVPDLMTFGKVMGGGFPAAAFGGRAELMQHLAPVGGVYQAGTLSGNPVATAAGLTTLRLATPEVYAHVDRGVAAAAGSGRRGAVRGRGAARHPGRREPVQRLLRRRRADRAGLRHRGLAVHRHVRRVLPRHARIRGLSAPERVRGLVSVGGPR